MTFTEFSTGALYILSSHAQLALCLSVVFFLLGMRGLPEKSGNIM